ncbi:hypothetical protein [Crenalkalicoccus roseus]|uniref:hypothetical protein n=1 Tax=Crenalkalicoccus roseus TaxID=1485588 RepID=UPI0010813C1C|nr:hypothetical protein [Crenalkalicoccus roseus]
MQTLYFIAMVIGVGWLMLWSILPKPPDGRFWSPFDMREDLEAAARAGEAEGKDGPREPAPPARSWRARAEAARTAPRPLAEPVRRAIPPRQGAGWPHSREKRG